MTWYSKLLVSDVASRLESIRKLDGYELDWRASTRWNGHATTTRGLPCAIVRVARKTFRESEIEENVTEVVVQIDVILTTDGSTSYETLDEFVDAAAHDLCVALYTEPSGGCSYERDLIDLVIEPYHGTEQNPDELGLVATARYSERVGRATEIEA